MSEQLPFVERMVNESDALIDNINKLLAFIGTKTFQELPSYEKRLMLDQVNAMQTYCNTLNVRISLHFVHQEGKDGHNNTG